MSDPQPISSHDTRGVALRAWLASIASPFGLDLESLRPASADASFRRYFRVDSRFVDADRSHATLIVMDAPPQHESCAAFIRVAKLMREAGLNVPTIVGRDLEQGFLLLTDLGIETYLHRLDPNNAAEAQPLFQEAIEALIRWQLASKPDVLPSYDKAKLLSELQLFPDWYIARHLQIDLSPAQREVIDSAFGRIIEVNIAESKVYVHRDYMPRNLMVSAPGHGPNPGVLDFQDAVYGPISYDVASLFKDAFLSWDEEVVLDWTIRYWERARKAGLPVQQDFGDFYRHFEWMGLQRHLKVLGIFARIHYRDGKPQYLADTPRFVRYVRQVVGRYSGLAPLRRLFDEIERTETTSGLTF